MKISDIKKIEFWTRELKMPIFWFFDLRSKSRLGDNILCLHKAPSTYYYYLNGRDQQDAEKSYKYFSRPDNFKKHFHELENTLEQVKQVVSELEGVDWTKIADQDLKKYFYKTYRLLVKFTKAYTKSEEAKMRKFENVQDRQLKENLHKLGQLRLKMRQASEPLFFIMLAKLMKQISKRYKIKFNDLFYYDLKDMSNLLEKNKPLNARVVDNRRQGYTIWIMSGQQEILTGKKHKQLWKWVNAQFVKGDVKKLKGAVANQGRAKGKVRLILHTSKNISKQVAKFKKGEILVTEMTRPGTIVACKKAAAIITDEGGITSHAAIISREFNIPCVVGVKVGTQVLKDGDEVEVDADNGIVRIVNSGS